MEWTDASGTVYQGAATSPPNFIPAGATDTTGGALPGGSVRFRNVGSLNGQLFDLLVTVPATQTVYSDSIAMAYVSPQTSAARQALLFGHFACLGFAIQTAVCASGASVGPVTAGC